MQKKVSSDVDDGTNAIFKFLGCKYLEKKIKKKKSLVNIFIIHFFRLNKPEISVIMIVS
jgi:hypothetical protein